MRVQIRCAEFLVFYYYALFRLGEHMLMIKKKFREENTLQRGWNKIIFEALSDQDILRFCENTNFYAGCLEAVV